MSALEKINVTVNDRYTSDDGKVTYVNEVALADGSRMTRVSIESVLTFGQFLREDVEELSAGAHDIVGNMGDSTFDFATLLERLDLRLASAVHLIRALEECAGLRRDEA